MVMREKLIEILNENFAEFCNVDIIAGHCKIRAITFDVDRFADHLIANGVTIQQWISVAERLPDKDDDYLAVKAFGKQRWCDVVRFAKDGRKVNIYDFEREWENVWYIYDSEWGYITLDTITHWMPLPKLPSGERRTDADC